VIDDAYFAICLKTNPYTFLGSRPLDIAPDAGLDNRLSFLTFRTLGATALLKVTASALRGRGGKRLGQYRRVAYATDLEEVSVSGFGPFPYQVDGDYLGDAEQLHIRYEPDALSLIVP
jgi:diacylglycerol kinase family enzyme